MRSVFFYLVSQDRPLTSDLCIRITSLRLIRINSQNKHCFIQHIRYHEVLHESLHLYVCRPYIHTSCHAYFSDFHLVMLRLLDCLSTQRRNEISAKRLRHSACAQARRHSHQASGGEPFFSPVDHRRTSGSDAGSAATPSGPEGAPRDPPAMELAPDIVALIKRSVDQAAKNAFEAGRHFRRVCFFSFCKQTEDLVLRYCKSLNAGDTCMLPPLALICRLPSFYGLVETDGRPFVELFFLFLFCSFFNHLFCLLVTILVFRIRLNPHVKTTGTRKKLCSIGSRRG